MPHLIGIVLSVGVAWLAKWVGFDRDRAFYPTVMIVIASYVAFHVVFSGDSQVKVGNLRTIVCSAGWQRSTNCHRPDRSDPSCAERTTSVDTERTEPTRSLVAPEVFAGENYRLHRAQASAGMSIGLTDVRQTNSLIRPDRGVDGRWPAHAWAPVDGGAINGLRVGF
jgi:hypothetical protein